MNAPLKLVRGLVSRLNGGAASALTLVSTKYTRLGIKDFSTAQALVSDCSRRRVFGADVIRGVASWFFRGLRRSSHIRRIGFQGHHALAERSGSVAYESFFSWTPKLFRKLDSSLRKRAFKEVFGRSSPLLAFVGVTLGVQDKVTKEDEIQSVVREIRKSASRAVSSYKVALDLKNDNSHKTLKKLEELDLGSHIAKGASGVVYEAKIKDSLDNYPLAVKMMFNYHAESNAYAIFKVMSREILPAQVRNLSEKDSIDSLSEYLSWRAHSETTELPYHPNIVEMYSAFVDRVPNLSESMTLYPDALPFRLNPGGYGRNMSLFLVMKKYDVCLKAFLEWKKDSSLSCRSSLLLLVQLLEGILHMARNNVAHRDLKSDNILLELPKDEKNGTPKLVITDFGCSIGNLIISYPNFDVDKGGNPALMAPEIKRARPGTFIKLNYEKADLWAASNIAYEIFGAPNPAYQRNYTSTLPRNVPRVVNNLIKAMGESDPLHRISTDFAANVCQLLLWAPREFFNRPEVEISSVVEWLLTLTTKLVCEARFFSTSDELTEFDIISTFLRRISLYDLIEAIEWIRSHI